MRPAWAIYYRDGSCFTSLDGCWDAAPTEGVLAVVENVDDRRTVRSGGDFYRLEDDGTVVCTEDASAILHAVGVVPLSTIKFGWYASNSAMARLFRRIEQEWTD